MAISAAKARLAATTGVTTADVVVPLTKAATVARVGSPVGVLLIAPSIGWGLGQGGLVAYAAATGTDYQKMVCDTPEWYQGTNAFLSFGITPDCKSTVITPNADQIASYTLTYGGGAVVYSSVGTYGYWCWSSSVPAGNVAVWKVNAGDAGWANMNGGSSYCPSGKLWTNPAPPVIGVKRASDGVIVASATGVVPDPVRTPSCKITWSDSTTTTGTGSTYKDSTGLPMSAAGLGCEQAYVSKPGGGPALLPSTIEVDSTDAAGAKTQISKQDVPAFTATETKSMSPSVPGAGLVLRKTIGTVTDSCNTWAADCTNWWTKTSAGTVETVGTETFKCTFGGDPVSLDQCGVYRHTFDTQTATPTITDPATGTDTLWIAKPNPVNTANPGALVGDDPTGQCVAEWPSAPDPIAWVLLPMKCALVWAFVPRTSVLTATQTAIATAWAPTIVGRLPTVVSTAIVVPAGGSGCQGPHVQIPLHLAGANADYDGYPLSACADPAASIASWARLIGSAILIWFTGLGIIRRASSVVHAPGVGSAGGGDG
ncbi:hypothetical protein [Microbacterium panaciterrae]|uniref:hypothetical protein n=1 Tax=Microbacterium panaciterrae TaxID=985759 RepID=UPI0031EE1D2D